MKKSGILLIVISILSFCTGCTFDDMTDERLLSNDLDYILNHNIRSIQSIVRLQEEDMSISALHFSSDNIVTLHVKNHPSITFAQAWAPDSLPVPSISIAPLQTDYYWKLGDDYIKDSNGEKIKVTDERRTPSLLHADGSWFCVVGSDTSLIGDSNLSEVFTSVSTINNCVVITFPSQYQLTIPLATFRVPKVPLRAFYKDVFLDAGIGLTSRKNLAAARYLELSLEGISFPRSNATTEDSILQNTIIKGSIVDQNGRLLYPDGQPRYKLLFVNGGSSVLHGKSLNDESRHIMRQFVRNGGSYVGTCAGAFFVTNGYDDSIDFPYYLSLWPSTMNHTGMAKDSTGMFIEPHSPLLDYYDFGADYYVSDVRHNHGGYPVHLPSGTEIHARYDYPGKADVHLQPCLWSYKASRRMGRIVMEGSHPEEVTSGERRDLTAAMILYAMDGVGNTTIKGFLQNGKTRMMDSGSEANRPNHAKIGDLQCHHFALLIPEGAENISVCVSSPDDGDLSLYMNRFTFAYPDSAEYVSADKGSHPSLSLPSLEPGLWYVCVKCNTTVEAIQTDYGQDYIDTTGVLNGLPYQITAFWQQIDSSPIVPDAKRQANDNNRKGVKDY